MPALKISTNTLEALWFKNGRQSSTIEPGKLLYTFSPSKQLDQLPTRHALTFSTDLSQAVYSQLDYEYDPDDQFFPVISSWRVTSRIRMLNINLAQWRDLLDPEDSTRQINLMKQTCCWLENVDADGIQFSPESSAKLLIVAPGRFLEHVNSNIH